LPDASDFRHGKVKFERLTAILLESDSGIINWGSGNPVFTTGLRLDIFAKAYLNVKKNSLAQNTQSNGSFGGKL